MMRTERVRRTLSRFCSPETMERVVDPILADISWEGNRHAWLGYLDLARALTLHVVSSTPSALGRVYSDDAHAIPKAMTVAAAAALVGALALSLPMSTTFWAIRSHPVWAVLLLLPQAVALTLPAALLVAIPMAFRRQRPSARLLRRILILGEVCGAAVFIVAGWMVPETNHSYRVLLSGNPALQRGTNEKSFAVIKRDLEVLRTNARDNEALRGMEYAYQVRLALTAAPVPLTLLAVAVALSRFGRRRPALTGCASMCVYLFALDGFFFFAADLFPQSALAPSLLAWFPNVAITLLAAIALWRLASSRFRASPVTEDR